MAREAIARSADGIRGRAAALVTACTSRRVRAQSDGWVREQVEEFEASNGAARPTSLRGTEWPIVVITSRGAKSGKLRKNPVMRVEHDGVYAAVASKGGAPENPAWFHNFVAHPEVDLQDGPEKRTYRARSCPRATSAPSGGSGRSRQSRRTRSTRRRPTGEIPVFLLERTERPPRARDHRRSVSPPSPHRPAGCWPLTLVNLAIMSGWFGPIQVLLAEQMPNCRKNGSMPNVRALSGMIGTN